NGPAGYRPAVVAREVHWNQAPAGRQVAHRDDLLRVHAAVQKQSARQQRGPIVSPGGQGAGLSFQTAMIPRIFRDARNRPRPRMPAHGLKPSLDAPARSLAGGSKTGPSLWESEVPDTGIAVAWRAALCSSRVSSFRTPKC